MSGFAAAAAGPISLAEWEAKGAALFGPDKERWRFECPMCGNEASIEKARTEWPELRGRGWAVYAECVGRYLCRERAPRMKGLDDTPCDWCAYGLFRGPIVVRRPDGTETACFEFAQPAPAEVRP